MAQQADAIAKVQNGSPHLWQFVRVGGFDQVQIKTGADLLALEQLDQKLWTALSCPTHGLEFDSRTLQLIDTDGDGRIRVPEIIAAVNWAGSLLKDPDDLVRGSDQLALAAIDDSSEEGRQIVRSARQILTNLGQTEASVITARDTADTARIFAATRFNGDGIICPDAADDEATRRLIQEIMDCMGTEPDRSGQPGIGEAGITAFFAEAEATLDWWRQAENEAARVLPLGDQTESAAAIFHAVQGKIDDYFVRCRLAAYDNGAGAALNPAPADYQALAARDLSLGTEAIAALPIARVEPEGSLPLGFGLNPAWAEAVDRLRDAVIQPLLGAKDALSLADWNSISATFAGLDQWLAAKPKTAVEKLGIDRLREILQGPERQMVFELLARDRALQPEAEAIAQVDRLVRYHRDLCELANNFVAFRDFYTPGRRAIFQAGTLYLDGRSCDLCVRVDNADGHSALASLSRTYLAYCQCRRRGGEDTMTIAAAFTDGDADNLRVGRNGVFYDRGGRDWDASIIKIVEHPISIRQAFWAPYKRVARMINEQIEKFAVARDKAVDSKAAAGVGAAAITPPAPVPAPVPAPAAAATVAAAPPPLPFDVGKFAGIFAAIGLAIGAIGTALASFLTGLMGLSWYQVPLALAGIVLLISGPSMIIAWLKLRQRNLGPILDACGWAINTRARINLPFGASLTAVARLPQGAGSTVQDPFADKRRPWKLWLVLIAIAAALIFAWQRGYFKAAAPPEKAQSTAIAPAAPATPQAPAAPAAPPAAPPAPGAPAPAPTATPAPKP